MIEVVIRHKGSGVELGRIDIENTGNDASSELGNYSVRFGVDKVKGVGFHRRGIFNFPRRKYNVLALLLQALNTLEERDLELDEEFDNNDFHQKQLGGRGLFS